MHELGSYVDTNTRGTAVLVETLLKTQHPLHRLVLASSRAVYGEGSAECPTHGPITPAVRARAQLEQGRFGLECPHCGTAMRTLPTPESRERRPTSVYAQTKAQQEDLCQLAADAFGLPTVNLRYFNFYGSRQTLLNPYSGVISVFYNRIKAGNPISLYEGGLPERDFVNVEDVARANCLAMDTDAPAGACFNIGAGANDTIGDLAIALGRACGREPFLEDRGEYRVGDIFSCYADLTTSEQVLGYRPQVGLAEGLEEFVRWAAGQMSEDRYQKTVEELSKHGLFGRAK